MIETTAAGSFTEPLLAAVIAAVGSPTILWLALKGKLTDWFMPRPELKQMRETLENDINGVGARQDAQLTLYNQMRGEVDQIRDRCTKMEARQDPVAEAVRRMEGKLDESLGRMEELARQVAVHSEQIKTLFNQKGGAR